jgi:phosphoserine phosphatase RsbU/P
MLEVRPPKLVNVDTYAMLDGMVDWYAILNTDHRLLYANNAMAAALGCDGACCTCSEACLAAKSLGQGSVPAVEINGRLYRQTISRKGANVLACWQDITREQRVIELLKRQYDRMRRDIVRAQNIQSSLLPQELARAEGYRFSSLYKPCEEMSGDIFDIFRIGRDNIAFYIADVSGHGVTAAMLTVFFSTTVRVEMHPTDMPGDVLSRVQRRFAQLHLEEQHYITAFLARLELSTGRLYWTNAGHICPPVLVDVQGESTLEMAGIPICRWFEDQEYETSEGMFQPGAKLVLYSDGLESLWQCADKPDMVPSIGSILARESGNCLEAIWNAAGQGIGDSESRDDTTLLLIERMTQQQGNEEC